MEDRTKFNLGQNIENWKSELNKNGIMTRDNVDELESHLQDEIHGLQKLGLNDKESFLVAKIRIGKTEHLQTEYQKVNKKVIFIKRMLPYLKGILMFMAFTTLTGIITKFSKLTALKLGMTNLNLISIVFLLALTLVLSTLFYINFKSSRFHFQKLITIPTLVAVIVIGKLFLALFDYIFLPSIIYFKDGLDFKVLYNNLSLYQSLVILLILIVSCVMFYSSKKGTKIKIAE